MVKPIHLLSAGLILGIGLLATLVALVALERGNTEPVQAQQMGAGGSGDLIAVPLQTTANKEVLVVFRRMAAGTAPAVPTARRSRDRNAPEPPTVTQTEEWGMAVYEIDQNRNQLSFVAARRPTWDTKIVAFNDSSRGEASVDGVRGAVEAQMESGEDD